MRTLHKTSDGAAFRGDALSVRARENAERVRHLAKALKRHGKSRARVRKMIAEFVELVRDTRLILSTRCRMMERDSR